MGLQHFTLHVDVGCFFNSTLVGFEVVGTESGAILAAISGHSEMIYSVLGVEAGVVYEGLRLAERWGLSFGVFVKNKKK